MTEICRKNNFQMKEETKNKIIFGGIPFLVLFGIIGISCLINTYSFKGYWYSAPNGIYEVLLSEVNYETFIVSFPICESCPSELHGDWGFKENLIFPSDYWGWLTVKLENNVITEIIKIG